MDNVLLGFCQSTPSSMAVTTTTTTRSTRVVVPGTW